MEHRIVLECKNITKHFGQTHALNDVSISFEGGKITGLIGENGSGKSTLMGVATGMVQPTSGEMTLNGKPWKPANSLEAYNQGVRIIVQEANTIANLTIAENLFAGNKSQFSKGCFVSKSKLRSEAQKALESIGCTDINAAWPTRQIDMESRKLVEIARAAYGEVTMFIVDETTTALSHSGRQILYAVMKRMAENGVAVVIISHDLEEMQTQCDLLYVLRDGVLVGELDKEDFNENAIKKKMIGRDLNTGYYRTDEEGYSDQVVLKAENITTLKEIKNFNLELHKGEILGIGGLSECGMHTIGKALYGFEPVLAGQVTNVLNNHITITSSHIAQKSGMAYVSKNRDTESLALSAPIRENIQSTGYDENIAFFNVISYKKEAKYVQKMIDVLKIKCNSMDDEVRSLSGGNKQKVVFGKWVARNSDILILDCPTRGVDIGVKAAMYALINEMKKNGKSIVLISEELPELIGMSDRIIIMKDGKVTTECLRVDHPTENFLIEAMI